MSIKLLDELKEQSRQSYVSPFDIAIVSIGLGQRDQALEWLEKSYADRSHWLAWIKIDPRLDSLRWEPRFVDLLGRTGIPQ